MITEHGENLQAVDVLGKNPQWIAFVVEESLRDVLSQIALKEALPPASVQTGGIDNIRPILSSGIEPKILIIDLSKSADLLSDIKMVMGCCTKPVRMLVIGKDDHVSIFRELKHLGVMDYLILPLQEKELQNSIHEALVVPAAQEEKNTTLPMKPFTVIIGSHGGVGASTTCVNLAWQTAMRYQKKVCLIDFDFYHGSICILLDLVQNTGLNDALSEIDRLDELFLKRLLLQKDNNLSVLTGQLGFEKKADFSPEAIKALMQLLRSRYDYLFADLPSSLYEPYTQTVLSLTDQVIILTDFSLASVQDILRLKIFLATYLPNIKYKIVGNTIFPIGGVLEKAMFEKAIGSVVETILPYCKATMLEGMNLGDPLVKTNPNHAYTKQLDQLMIALYPPLKLARPEKISLLKKWWGTHQ